MRKVAYKKFTTTFKFRDFIKSGKTKTLKIGQILKIKSNYKVCLGNGYFSKYFGLLEYAQKYSKTMEKK